MINVWIVGSVAVVLGFLVVYGYGVWLYVHGRGRNDIEGAVKSFLIMSGNGGLLQIERKGMGVVVEFCRVGGAMNTAETHLRIPWTQWSEAHRVGLNETFTSKGYQVIQSDNSMKWILEVRLFSDDIWAVGSAAEGARAANIALDALEISKEARFYLRLKGKKNWRIMNRAATGGDVKW